MISPRSRRDLQAAYARLFHSLVGSVNKALLPDTALVETAQRELFIGLLDIFGSEIFPTNGFEQLLINYANDKLQYFFTQSAISLVIAQ